MTESYFIIAKSAVLFLSIILIVRFLGRRWLAGRTGWDRTAGIVIAFIAAGMSVNLISLRAGVLALATWILLMIAANYFILKSKWVRDLVEGREIVVMQHGKVMEENLKEARMTPEDFLRLLRTKRVFQIASEDFDILHNDFWLGQDSFEKAEKKLLEQACEKAIEKAQMKKEDIQFYLAGDLMNQIVTSSFSARTLGSPYIGIFGACSTSMEGLALAALMVDASQADYVLAGTASHNSAVERQFRYPTEYGGQLPPTAQWTVTGAGAGIIAKEGSGPRITSATIGRVVDMGIADPFNMGAAMAPAAVDTIFQPRSYLALLLL